MARRPKRDVVLAAIAVLLVAVAALSRACWESSGSANVVGPPSAARPAPTAVPVSKPAEAVAPVALDALKAPRPEPVDATRNPFRFRPKALPPPPTALPRPAPELAGPPAGPPPPARIALKFIGIVNAPNAGPLAILSDPRGVYQGHEGDIIDGQYRILRIGVESIDLAYLDGRGRQTIRLTGQ